MIPLSLHFTLSSNERARECVKWRDGGISLHQRRLWPIALQRSDPYDNVKADEIHIYGVRRYSRTVLLRAPGRMITVEWEPTNLLSGIVFWHGVLLCRLSSDLVHFYHMCTSLAEWYSDRNMIMFTGNSEHQMTNHRMTNHQMTNDKTNDQITNADLPRVFANRKYVFIMESRISADASWWIYKVCFFKKKIFILSDIFSGKKMKIHNVTFFTNSFSLFFCCCESVFFKCCSNLPQIVVCMH